MSRESSAASGRAPLLLAVTLRLDGRRGTGAGDHTLLRLRNARLGATSALRDEERPGEVVVMAHATMDAMLADHRLVEEVDAVQAAWTEVAAAIGCAFEGVDAMGTPENIAAALDGLATAEVRARADVREALGLLGLLTDC